MRGPPFVWKAVGSPQPLETSGQAIRARHQIGHCASCNAPAQFEMSDAISDSFTTVRNASKAWPFGGSAICAACVWACKTLALRCAMWFARVDDEHGAGGIWFVPLRDALDVILSPPPPPFVAALPLYGIKHGGEAHGHRAVWWDQATCQPIIHPNVLIRLQSKHVAIYSTVATDSRVYPIQVDDAHEVMVDVELWRQMRGKATQLAAEMVASGVWPERARESLRTLLPPHRLRIGHAAWQARVEPFRRHHQAFWWNVFTTLLPIEDPNAQSR